jgi:hypothetical protein
VEHSKDLSFTLMRCRLLVSSNFVGIIVGI